MDAPFTNLRDGIQFLVFVGWHPHADIFILITFIAIHGFGGVGSRTHYH